MDYEEVRDAATPEEMRAELYRLSRSDSLVRHVFDMANYRGLSSEDKYTILAYCAMQERQKLFNQHLHLFASTTLQPILVDAQRSKP